MWKKGRSAICCVGLVALYGWADEGAVLTTKVKGQKKMTVFRAAAVRYQVKDVGRSVAFYTQHLDFKVELQSGSAFAKVVSGSLTLFLSGPQSSGSRPMPDGRKQEPGGWNRLVLEVDDLPACIAALKKQGLHFRNEMEIGPGGKQIQLEDPDGNPVELFEPGSSPRLAPDSAK
jgi:glyoxylase I family protein